MAETQDLQRLIISLEANIKGYERNLARANGLANEATRKIERNFDRMNAGVSAGFAAVGMRIAGLAAGVLSLERSASFVGKAVTDFAKLGDTADRINLTTDALQALRHITAQNGGEADDANNAMQRFSQSLGEAARGSGDLFKILQANNVSLRDKAGNLRSLDDMLGEFARLVAGASSQQERMSMAVDAFGRRAGPAMLGALMEIAQVGLPAVINQARDVGVVADAALIKKAQEIEDAWNKMATQIGVALKSRVISAIEDVSTMWDALSKKIVDFYRSLPGGNALISAAERGAGASGGNTFAERFGGMAPPSATGPTTKLPAKEAGGDGRDKFERESAQIQKRIELLKAEAETVGLGTLAQERAEASARLLNAAKEAGIPITEELRQKVGDLAQSYGEAAERVKKAQDAFQEIKDASRELSSAFSTAFKDMIFEAKSFEEAMQGLVKRLASLAIDRIFQRIFDMAIGSAFGVQLGGRAAGGPVSAGQPIMVGERGREVFVPETRGRIVPNDAVRPMSGGGTTFVQHISIDARGADAGAVARIDRTIEQMQRNIPQQVAGIRHVQQVRRVRP